MPSLPAQYTIGIVITGSGTITPPGATVNGGDSLTLSIAASPGSAIVEVLVDDVPQGAVTSVHFSNIQADHTVESRFGLTGDPIVTVSAGTGGDISPMGNVSVTSGGSVAATATPDPGYRILCWSVDGVVVQQGGLTYTLANVTTAHTLSVSFLLVDWINHIADGLVTVLKTMNGPAGGYTTDMTTAPAVVERAPTLVDWTSLPRPWLGVRFERIREQTPGTMGQYRVTGDFMVGFLVGLEGVAVTKYAPEQRAAILAQDIMRAVALDPQLSSILATGVAQPGEVLVSQDPNLGELAAYGSVVITATWLWQV